MKASLLLFLLLAFVDGSEDINANEIKRRMKLIGGIPSYGVQNVASKIDGKSSQPEIQYSDPELSLNYNASSSFNPQGMGHLYGVTKYFLSVIRPSESYPDGLLIDNGSGLQFGNVEENWLNWLQHYMGIAIVVAVGLAFAVMMPIIGLFFCCCRCGGKCGARSKHEKKHDPCKRTTITILLGCVAVIILFGVVCSFVTNERMKEGIEQLPDNITINLKDAELYLENTEKEVDNLLIVNFEELKKFLTEQFNASGEIVKDQLAVVSRAVALSNLTNIVSGMEVIKQDLSGIQKTTRRLQELASTLGDDLDITRDELLHELYNCRDIPACRELLNHHHVAQLKVVENFQGLPDVTQTFATISRLLGDQDSLDSIHRKVLEGQRNFNNIKFEISGSLEEVKVECKEALEKTGKKLAEVASKIKQSLNAMRKLTQELSKKSVVQANEFIDEYAIYRYYLGLGVSGALLLILLCITFGLLCGLCGKRPEDIYTDDGDCCSTISGGRFLMLAVWLIFLLSTVLMLIILAHFLIGVATDLVICQPLQNPSDNKIFELVDKYVSLKSIYEGEEVEDLTVSQIIRSFHNNETIYKALKLENIVNIDDIPKLISDFVVQKKINQFRSRIKIRTDNLELLTPDAKAKIQDLANSPLNDINFNKFTELLSIRITNINLTQLSYELRTNSEKIPDHASSGFDLTKIKKLLRAKARFLELLQQNSVAQIRNEIQVLKSNLTTLKEHLKFNHTSLRNALQRLLEEVESAQSYLRKNGTNQLKSLLNDFVEDKKKDIEDYFNRVVNKTKKDIGKSGPLSNAYNSTIVTGCNRIMDPFNGFWISVGWSILFFIPVIILSVKLATLYSKSEVYGPPGMYGESEYLYDAYADRDNMPLAMAHGVEKKKKGHHKNYKENNDAGGNGAYLQDYSAHLGRSERPSASNEAARYNDMAPKQWGDFVSPRVGPNNPPKYHHPSSTEYERPPPYYYPGPIILLRPVFSPTHGYPYKHWEDQE